MKLATAWTEVNVGYANKSQLFKNFFINNKTDLPK